ncbi:benzoylformate decarboxylase [Reyranella sp.]|jgi:benzoylformate decarboxylase|uniref:benzoylformate decarboxylase n=1 Tax=Reyranella sp. TaxID=1929291 RepID=UPI000BC8288A|nr:benzoylformate decarboxylase [Reyranella sp.]OYY44050.1 MAG: benzoylformate decarboxylase [Rhodospirillales bacterium 35-66-84]OYZ94726.1 MAG: benzoylformate decarboxylase [Rhodospirillales bacterium 24-66-33]OZB26200.1 MAG: benzoylformate decarboxylase [Rhodospirillales bacterium 39-66-50]HQS15086.1 benzoylformate decarboxylase [Reyranella sp.]HQT10895.1 benzoylformate decarboxylase [Reyranella sp.]
MRTVKDVTFDLLRKLGLTTVVGNPGSTEETFLKNFPDDFDYVMALQEASVVGIADGIAQGLRKPVIVNVHTGAGMGNALGCIVTAYQNKTPLIITAGQQTREMLLLEPLLTNIDAANLPRPWVKWAYEPARAEDIPAAFMRAYATAMQQPAGPVFLSLPLDDWDKPMPEIDAFRTVATRTGPDPVRVTEFAERINAARSPVIVYGSDLARSQAWKDGILFAETLGVPVWTAPFAERTPFPETHPQHAGALPAAIGPLGKKFAGHDLVIVVGAPVFRYYPYVGGDYIPKGTHLLQVTDDPNMSSKAPVGDSLVSDARLFLEAIQPQLKKRTSSIAAPLRPAPKTPDLEPQPLAGDAIMAAVRAACPADYVLVEEAPSVVAEMQDQFRIDKPDCFYTFASGGLGWDMPAAVGLALAERSSGRNRPVIALMGDGSFQYSIQALYTAVQQKARVVFVVLQNHEYAILKSFAELEETPNVPGLDLTGIDLEALAKGYGAPATQARTAAEVTAAVAAAIARPGASVVVVPLTRKRHPLL